MRDYDGKSATERMAERRARLIEAGYVLFGDAGYAGTSIRAVLRQAGLRDRYFAESFTSLDELLAAVLDEIYDAEYALCQAAVAAAPDPSAAARAMIGALADSLHDDPCRSRIKLREVLSAGPTAYARREAGLRRLADLVAGLLPDPVDGAPDPRLLALGIVAAANELLITWLDGGLANGPALTRDAVVDLVVLMVDALAERVVAAGGRPNDPA